MENKPNIESINVLENNIVYVIMSKCRRYIAKGSTYRTLVDVTNIRDKKKMIYFDSKKKAQNTINDSYFWNNIDNFPYENMEEKDYLEPVAVRLTFTII